MFVAYSIAQVRAEELVGAVKPHVHYSGILEFVGPLNLSFIGIVSVLTKGGPFEVSSLLFVQTHLLKNLRTVHVPCMFVTVPA